MVQETQESMPDNACKDGLDQEAFDEGRRLARTVALNCADEADQVGDFVQANGLLDGVTDFRFACRIRGYEGWQWAVTLYRDRELEKWTVNDSVLVATGKSLLAPKWIPWKDRITADDLSVTDSIGTDSDDPRMEEGYSQRTPPEEGSASIGNGITIDQKPIDAEGGDLPAGGDTADGDVRPSDKEQAPTQSAGSAQQVSDSADAKENCEDVDEVVEELLLSRRHVMSPLGRSETSKRWYQGQHGPKSLSTKTADGNVCSACGFYVPLTGELGDMFGVCANKWSPDDGRVVSMDHGCGEHSEIEQPEPSHLWIQTEPAYDDVHIDVVEKNRRNHHAQVELLERIAEEASQ